MTPETAVNIADGAVARGKQQILKSMVDPGCMVNSFSLSDFSYLWLDKNTTVMTYTANQDATCSGKKQVGKVIATTGLAGAERQMDVGVSPRKRPLKAYKEVFTRVWD